ncbi:N-alpha-acetyltransferase 30A [Drosophila mojavensis]|uniref:N-alpha-acetyltransferase 30A n=1 Tax=Drosophila mojavensis TaxID=7230 RepID=UPI00017CA959|nr:N-alpha-acetyltransferase 30A [Drosophila mojavensis]XP_032588325.1 N-alpha-acetyltransferase 30A [Drosophila mojavensis]XP_032588326.1 N-alpha-acetyltransferase 30A [Drosophila mojavensis]XP_043867612.1 N-alpha-acetyltransferase 30A [Drosophila mojavensis]
MADTATAATTATASKKKYRNKKKTQQPQKPEAKPAQGPARVKAVVHQSNGHVDSANEMAAINSLMEQVQLFNGHAVDGPKVTAESSSVAATVNGHANKSAAINNNNHINNNNNSSNNNNDVNNINSSSRNRKNNGSSSKAKNNNKSQASIEDSESGEHDTSLTAAVATSNTSDTSTANTHTSTATTAKIAAADSTQDEAPSTSAAAGAGATAAQPQEQEEEQQQTQLQLKPAITADEIVYKEYEAEHQMHEIMRLIQAELSEPYSIYTYRYFIYNWPKLCFLAAHDNQYVGAIVCKLDMHMNVRRGYIAMLAVRKEYRKLKIGTTLVTKAIEAMLADNADEVVLETEMRNEPALRLYENLGFVRDKRLFRYYLNGVDALRLKLWFR